MTPVLRVAGYAIVSADGMIADASGEMPPAIVNEADQRFFAQALDGADILVHGRNSHEHQPNSPQRRRLVLTRTIDSIEPDPTNVKLAHWNPAGATLEAACAALGVTQGTVAVIGGTEVFGLFLPRYDAFHLTLAARAHLPGGRPVFPGIPPATPDELLRRHGLVAGPPRILDAASDVTLVTWRRAESPRGD